VSDAGSNSGILLLRRRIPLLFAKKDLKTICFDPFNSFKSGSLTAAQRLLKSYLARNTRIAATFA
jgi:hypothetical protein